MNNFERIKNAFQHKRVDKIPFFELSISNKIYKEIFKSNGIIPNGSGSTKLNLFKSLFGKLEGKFYLKDIESEYFEKIGKFEKGLNINLVKLYEYLGIEMIPFRPYDFLISPFYRNYIGFSEDINNLVITIDIDRNKNIRWRIENSNNFWAEYKYEEKQDAVFMANDCIKENGEKELIRYIKHLKEIIPNKEKVLDNSGYQYRNINTFYDDIKRLSKVNDFFSVGYASIPYPSNATFHPLFLELMITKPEIILDYFEIAVEEVLALAKIQIQNGIGAIIDVTDWCYNSGPMFSPLFMEKFIAPYLKKVVDYCHDNNVYYIKHLDGNIKPLLEILIKDVGIDALHAIESKAGVDIAEVKKRYGDRITLIGNIDCSDLLINGSRAEIFNSVREIISNISKNSGHILSSSNSIHSEIPLQNLLYMLEARDKFGKSKSFSVV